MIKAKYIDRALIVDILSNSFDTNLSVNYIVKQDRKRTERIKNLMKYAFDVSWLFGDIFLSEDKKACALVLYPEIKKTNLKSVWLNIKLVFNCIGLLRVKQILERDIKIKSKQPETPIFYLWLLGVDPSYQKTGKGSTLLCEIIKESERLNKPVYLETSTLKNIPWYQKFGFTIVDELDLTYRLTILKKVSEPH